MLRITWELTAHLRDGEFQELTAPLMDGESHLLPQSELSLFGFITDQINCKKLVRANTGKAKDNSDRTRSTGPN